MSIFSKKQEAATVKVESSTSLKQQSVNALNTFQRVLDDLRSINESSMARQEELATEANRINQEILELESINFDNTKVINNIVKILS